MTGGMVKPRRRPHALQTLITTVFTTLLSSGSPVMARLVAGQAYARLESCGRSGGLPADIVSDLPYWGRALQNLKKIKGDLGSLAALLEQLGPHLSRRIGAGGPYASVNFSASHAHATVAGPGGLEERADVQVGLTVMAPYCRFPDHKHPRRRLMLFLSNAEVSLNDGEWEKKRVGGVQLVDAGEKFAIRCTAEPMLAVWCEVDALR
ncbi:dimethylsulfonioproprionate lyase family protein [Sinorhizobium sp. BG8]|uniref:dimethylsulfonioproprionate lyase family protein n=1 Tax=Sinorhizobium sp. BG8 TaxID=2613773 RepID=UPI00193E41ED|nr:dimethylsulfonioproprionate lyase family protein [Sinorhizobium sp. BG8]QRM57886.1 hypothetical protein F3Y30_25930 [Sinorhizobium sp. BG8]